MNKRVKKEAGEIMLESTIVMVIVMLMLVWILGVGFIYYQKYTVRIATNEVACKIANTYSSPASDPITAYISRGEVQSRALYFSSETTETNKLRADSYAQYIMDKANFNGAVKDVQVNLEHFEDGMGRSHIKVTTECTFKTPFGEGLELFGMSGETTYRVTSYADSTSIPEYVSAVATANAFTNGSIISFGGLVDKVVGTVESFAKMFKQLSK